MIDPPSQLVQSQVWVNPVISGDSSENSLPEYSSSQWEGKFANLGKNTLKSWSKSWNSSDFRNPFAISILNILCWKVDSWNPSLSDFNRAGRVSCCSPPQKSPLSPPGPGCLFVYQSSVYWILPSCFNPFYPWAIYIFPTLTYLLSSYTQIMFIFVLPFKVNCFFVPTFVFSLS